MTQEPRLLSAEELSHLSSWARDYEVQSAGKDITRRLLLHIKALDIKIAAQDALLREAREIISTLDQWDGKGRNADFLARTEYLEEK